MDRKLLESELDFLHANLSHYLTHWPEGNEGWRATPESFTLMELASHLYTQPAYLAAILMGAPAADVMAISGGPWTLQSPEDLRGALDRGMTQLKAKLAATADADFGVKPVHYPFGGPRTTERHLFDMITHIYHHRAQFHLYLKQLGQPVNTDDVFAS